ncbi:MAG: SDR family NAD(P)-dependent oxidoreductase [Kofleriaceae bacterium]
MTSPSFTSVVVGASTGLGRATARALATGARVIVAGRDLERTRSAVPHAADALAVDLADLADVRRFAGELAARAPIGALVCNAGRQDSGAPTFTRDGFESTFVVNHLAHFALVTALHAAKAFAPAARVIFVASGTIEPREFWAKLSGFRGARYTTARELAAGTGDPAVSDAQRARDRYASSKLCNLLAMRALAARIPATELGIFALDPGLMPGTALARDLPWHLRAAWHGVLPAIVPIARGTSSPRRSGRAAAWLATTPALAGTTGGYYDYRRRPKSLLPIMESDAFTEDLYTTSVELCG